MPNYIDIEEVVARFSPPEDLRSRQMRQEADQLGKRAFLSAVPGARPASSAEVQRFLEGRGFEVGAEWVRLEVCEGITRHVNVGWSNKAFDAFVGQKPAELKPTAEDGVGLLTPSEERLARMGLLDFYFIDLREGRVGRARANDVVSIPRRADGVPVGQWKLRWPGC